MANDSGQVPWGDLSSREKAARTTQQTFHLSVVFVGAAMTAGVAYLLYDTVFSPESKTSHFSRALEEVKGSAECRELLGPAKSIYAYGEPSGNRWTRNRPIASTTFKDARGVEHMNVKFYVEGELAKGTVRCEMVRSGPGEPFEYRLLTFEVPGRSYFPGWRRHTRNSWSYSANADGSQGTRRSTCATLAQRRKVRKNLSFWGSLGSDQSLQN